MSKDADVDRLKLLPCPFCGSTDVDPKFSYFRRPAEEGGDTYGHEPGCMKCGATAPAEIWNRRQSLSQEAVRDAALELTIRQAIIDWNRQQDPQPLKIDDFVEGQLANFILDQVRALKREPNAAGRATRSPYDASGLKEYSGD